MIKRLLLVLVFIQTCAVYAADYGDSNYLLYPTDSNTYAPGSPSWGVATPTVGTEFDNPTAYGGSTKTICDESELLGRYGGGTPSAPMIVYSRFTPQNTSGELVLIHGTGSTAAWVMRLSDRTVSSIPLRMNLSLGSSSYSLGEINELRWDYTGSYPYRLYFVGRYGNAIGSEDVSMSFYYVDITPSTLAQSDPVLIHDFSTEFPSSGTYPTGGFTNTILINDVEGDSSNDSRYWAWQVLDVGTGGSYVPWAFVSYDKQTDTVLGRMQRDCTGVSGCVEIDTQDAYDAYHISRPNMIEIVPDGSGVHINWGRAYSGSRSNEIGTDSDGPHKFDLDFTNGFRIGADQGHSGWAWNASGHPVFVYQNNRTDYIDAVDVSSSTAADCTLVSGDGTSGYNYACGEQIAFYTEFTEGSYTIATGMHFSKIYDLEKYGWVAMNAASKTDWSTGWARNVLLMVELLNYADSNRRIWRIAPEYHRPLASGDSDVNYAYRSEGTAALNFDATEIWYTGNNESPYVVDDWDFKVFSTGIPNDWASVLNGTSTTRYYLDADGDGYSPGTYQDSGSDPGETWYTAGELTSTSGDCDDSNAAINPGATDSSCDGIDQDCSGSDNCPVSISVSISGATISGETIH